MSIQIGNNTKLNNIKGVSKILQISDSEKSSLSSVVFPENIIIKDSNGILYLTDGVTPVSQLSSLKIIPTLATVATSGSYNDLSNKPTSMTPTSHTHGSITNDGKLGTASMVVVTDSNKAIDVSSVTSTELGYLSGVTSSVQTQINGKADDSSVVHTTGNESISGTKSFNSDLNLNYAVTDVDDIVDSIPGTGNSDDYVHLTGNETVNGIKSFPDGIVANVSGTCSKDGDGNTISSTYGKLAGTQTWTGDNSFSSDLNLNFINADVSDIVDSIPGLGTAVDYVHLTGSESVNGVKSFPDGIVANVSGNCTRDGDGNTITSTYGKLASNQTWSGENTTHNIKPEVNATYSLGNPSYRWASVYANNYYYGTTAWGLDQNNVWSGSNQFSKRSDLSLVSSVTDCNAAFTGLFNTIFFNTRGSSNFPTYGTFLYAGYSNDSAPDRYGQIQLLRSTDKRGDTNGGYVPDTSFKMWRIATHYLIMDFMEAVRVQNDGTYNYFAPIINNATDLGLSTKQWNKIYSKEYYHNGTQWGLDKANTWSGENSFSSNANFGSNVMITGDRLRFYDKNDQVNVTPSSSITKNIYFTDKNGTAIAYFSFQHRYDSSEPFRTCWRQQKHNGTNNYFSVNFNNLGQFYPETADISLGTSSNKWASVYSDSYYYGTTPFTDKFVTSDTQQAINGKKAFTKQLWISTPQSIDIVNNLAETTGGTGLSFWDNNRYWCSFDPQWQTNGAFRFNLGISNYTTSGTQGWWAATSWEITKDFTALNIFSTHGNASLGTSTNKWNKVYANSYYYGNTAFTDKFVTTDTNQTINGNKDFNYSNFLTVGGYRFRIRSSSQQKGTVPVAGVETNQWTGFQFVDKNNTSTAEIIHSYMTDGRTMFQINVFPNHATADKKGVIQYQITQDSSLRFLSTDASLQPIGGSTHSIGAYNNRWLNVYADNYYLRSTAFGNIVTHNTSEFATASHAHSASDITSGTIDIARLPQGALDRLITVADQTARYALTTSDISLGDTVKQLDTGELYIVTDVTNLNNSNGYTIYTAGTATKAYADEDGNNIKTSYGKLAGANTWTGSNVFTQPICLAGDRNAYIIPTYAGAGSGMDICTQDYVKPVRIGNWITSNNTRVLDTSLGYLECRTGTSSDENIVTLNAVGTDTQLGTSTNKWKTINGLNPGALSLPTSSYVEIDTTNWNLTGADNSYIPPEDGYLICASNTCTDVKVYDFTTRICATSHSSTSKDNYAYIPVRKNDNCIVGFVGTNPAVRFYPCLGNV